MHVRFTLGAQVSVILMISKSVIVVMKSLVVVRSTMQRNHPLTCPFHALVCEIECCNRAHTELGRRYSNYPEASHNVLVQCRSKEKYLQSTHYMISTNMGLLQGNMTWLGKKHGLSFHWLLDFFDRLKLPLFDGMADALKKGNEICATNLEKKKTEKAKEKRIT